MFPIILWALPVPSPDNVTVPKLSPPDVIFPVKFEFKIIFPSTINFNSSVVPGDKFTVSLKVTVLVVFTFTEPAVTGPVNVTPPFNWIFPFSISVYPETVFEPVKTKFAI